MNNFQNYQINYTMPLNSMTFKANGNKIKRAFINVKKGDAFVSHNVTKLPKDANPYDFLSIEEQAIWDRLQLTDKAYEEFTQEEKDVTKKFSKLLGEITGLATPSKEVEKGINEVIKNGQSANLSTKELIGYKLKSFWNKFTEIIGK